MAKFPPHVISHSRGYLAGALAEAERQVGPFEQGGELGVSDWHTRHRRAMAAVAAVIEKRLAGKVSQTTAGATRVQICGLTASSSSGLAGAIRNWLTAAEKRLTALEMADV